MFKIVGFKSRISAGADLFLVRQYRDGGLFRILDVEDRRKGGVGANAIVLTVAAYH